MIPAPLADLQLWPTQPWHTQTYRRFFGWLISCGSKKLSQGDRVKNLSNQKVPFLAATLRVIQPCQLRPVAHGVLPGPVKFTENCLDQKSVKNGHSSVIFYCVLDRGYYPMHRGSWILPHASCILPQAKRS